MVSAGLLAFSQTLAGGGDEDSCLLAAQLINAGKKPYLDFFYDQVPLYAYITAAWLRVFDNSWRSAHLLSALATSGTLMLIAGFLFRQINDPEWKLATAVIGTLFVGLHPLTITFGTVGMPYALCSFFMVSSFCLAIEAVEREKGWLPLWTGVAAGCSAGSTLLAAPVMPIALLWMLRQTHADHRARKGLQFLGGAVIPFLPALWLTAQAPRQALFNIVEFHLFYRRDSMEDAIWRDLITSYEFFYSAPVLILVLLAFVGLLFLNTKSAWSERRREKFYLCGWLLAGLGAYLANTLPAYDQYFFLLIPFLGSLAALGVYAIGSRIGKPERAGWLVALFVGLFLVALIRPLLLERGEFDWWQKYEEVAREVNGVTPSGGEIFSEDNFIYVAARRLPPEGLDYSYIHGRGISPALGSILHLEPPARLQEWLAAGRFDTVVIYTESIYNDSKRNGLRLAKLYARHIRVNEFDIYSNRIVGESDDISTPIQNVRQLKKSRSR
jgi:hypothetical protein